MTNYTDYRPSRTRPVKDSLANRRMQRNIRWGWVILAGMTLATGILYAISIWGG